MFGVNSTSNSDCNNAGGGDRCSGGGTCCAVRSSDNRGKDCSRASLSNARGEWGDELSHSLLTPSRCLPQCTIVPPFPPPRFSPPSPPPPGFGVNDLTPPYPPPAPSPWPPPPPAPLPPPPTPPPLLCGPPPPPRYPGDWGESPRPPPHPPRPPPAPPAPTAPPAVSGLGDLLSGGQFYSWRRHRRTGLLRRSQR